MRLNSILCLCILVFSTLWSNSNLQYGFTMEYIIQIEGKNRGVLDIKKAQKKTKELRYKVTYHKIDKSYNLPFYNATKTFKLSGFSNPFEMQQLQVPNSGQDGEDNYQFFYNLFASTPDNLDEIVEMANISNVDRKSLAIIYNDDKQEPKASVPKRAIFNFEAIILAFFANNLSVLDNRQFWLFEPQANFLLFNVGIIAKADEQMTFKDKNIKVTKYTIGRIGLEGNPSIALFNIYAYQTKKKNAIPLKLASTTNKWAMVLDGFNKELTIKNEPIDSFLKGYITQPVLKRYETENISIGHEKFDYKGGRFSYNYDIFKALNTQNISRYVASYLNSSKHQKSSRKDRLSVSETEACELLKKTQNKSSNKQYIKNCKTFSLTKKMVFDKKQVEQFLSKKYNTTCVIVRHANKDKQKFFKAFCDVTNQESGQKEKKIYWTFNEEISKPLFNNRTKPQKESFHSSRINQATLDIEVTYAQYNPTTSNDYEKAITIAAGRLFNNTYFKESPNFKANRLFTAVKRVSSDSFGIYYDKGVFLSFVCEQKYTFFKQWQYRTQNNQDFCVHHRQGKDKISSYRDRLLQDFNGRYPILKLMNRSLDFTTKPGFMRFDFLGIKGMKFLER